MEALAPQPKKNNQQHWNKTEHILSLGEYKSKRWEKMSEWDGAIQTDGKTIETKRYWYIEIHDR